MANISYEIINDKIILRGKGNAGKATLNSEAGTMLPNITADEKFSRAEQVITGKVSDETNTGIVGVSITLKGTSSGSATNANGNYSISLPDNLNDPVLVFSYIGYVNQEIAVNGRRTINVVLQKAEKILEDVVVVGYGTQRRISVTGAVDAIGKKAIEGRPVANVSQALQGVSPNLIIQQRNFEPGQGVNINIRGLGTLGDNTPLVVIDGIPGGDINLLNPNDIESVSILKDAGTAAIYGSRSANGVVLISTKKGKKNERPSVT
ncbi:MAG: SusC/RagA family TonB-linked outer membrane protein, partial [Chitinophagaceae bacterium]